MLWPGTSSQSGAIVQALATEPAAPPASVTGPQQSALSQQIDAALRADSWPQLNPSLDSVIHGPKAPADMLPCGAIVLPPNGCTWGAPTAPHTAVLLGDSLSMAYAESAKYLAAHVPGWKVRVAGAFGCQFVTSDVRISTTKSWQSACTAHNDDDITLVKTLRPDLVIVTNTSGPRTDIAGDALSDAQWAAHVGDEIAKLRAEVGRVVILDPPPWDKQVAACYTKISRPIDCVSRAHDDWYSHSQVQSDLAVRFSGVYINPEPWFCDPAGLCPSFVDTTPAKQDLEHPSAAYIDKIAPVMLEAFRSHGLFT